MSDLFENALDSVRMGLRHHLDTKLENRDKWVILTLFHAVELLVKELLWTEDPTLIFKNPTTKDPEAMTVGLHEALKRLEERGIDVPPEYRDILKDLQRRRNRIEHHRFLPEPSHRAVIGEALKFIGYFLEDWLGENLEDHLPRELFLQAKELMLDYERLVQKAESSMDAVRRRYSPKDQTLLDTAFCPECGNRTVLIDGEEKRCHYCDEEQDDLQMCSECGEYVPSSSFAGSSICSDCFSYHVSRD